MEPSINWLDDPQVFRVGTLPAHSDHRAYRSGEEIERGVSSYIQSLDGDWQFQYAKNPADRPVGFFEPDYDRDHFFTIQVPGHIELENFSQIHYINTLYPWEGKVYRRPAYVLNDADTGAGMFSAADNNCVGAYAKRFDLEEPLRNKRVTVQFDGVEQAMYLWLNGHFVGYAEDSFSQSEFDLTPYIQDTDNVIAVEVFKQSTAAFLEDQDMFRFSGIFRSVRLTAQPEIHVNDLAIHPTVTADLTTGHLAVTLQLNDHPAAGTVSLTVTDDRGEMVAEASGKATEQVRFGDFEVANVRLWSHSDPYRYHLQLTVRDADGAVLEVVPYDFGFRRFELVDKVMMLNGERLILNGVNRHEWNPDRGRAITQADMVADLQVFKENNINAVRTCHYPDQIPWYTMCDEAGIYMMAETNLETHGSWQKMGAVEPSYNVPGSVSKWRDAVLDRAKNNYEVFKNHPSILFWSLGNESYAGEVLAEMNAYYKRVDPTRLTHYEGVYRNRAYADQISDVESRMYETPENIKAYLDDHPEKPFLNCEYMHDMGNSLGGMASYVNLIDQYPMYQGGFIWDYIDQALYVTDEVTGNRVLRYGGDFDDRHSDYDFSGDGLMFANRQPKPAMQEVRYYYGQYNN
ncbi:glycoside hydrolase family 2 TIM barrel-domain containing protein [uncultured Secundilactobacillus sp.]|uniref:glycoside hydrolase family 2 TIM barrel-domain containing protein n=1 Tax=uncultured Secundilactobacillus sp. TaxID=2813935 RepID=UPI0025884E44|nr:glycoside hydrolase family 2 TIM barrel-domain containing protein [uncultured Secundilactobacillus sp.]